MQVSKVAGTTREGMVGDLIHVDELLLRKRRTRCFECVCGAEFRWLGWLRIHDDRRSHQPWSLV